MNRMSRLPAWVLVMVFVISACGGKQPEPAAAPPPARRPSVVPAAQASEAQPTLQAYDSEGRRDPFQPVKAVKRRKKKTGGQSTIRLRRTSLDIIDTYGDTDGFGPAAAGVLEQAAGVAEVIGQDRA